MVTSYNKFKLVLMEPYGINNFLQQFMYMCRQSKQGLFHGNVMHALGLTKKCFPGVYMQCMWPYMYFPSLSTINKRISTTTKLLHTVPVL